MGVEGVWMAAGAAGCGSRDARVGKAFFNAVRVRRSGWSARAAREGLLVEVSLVLSALCEAGIWR